MKNKYDGDFNNQDLYKYFDRLTPKFFKLMPMKENNDLYLDKYLNNLLSELCGGNEIIYSHNYFFELIFNLEMLQNTKNVERFNQIVKNCLNKINKIKEGLIDE